MTKDGLERLFDAVRSAISIPTATRSRIVLTARRVETNRSYVTAPKKQENEIKLHRLLDECALTPKKLHR